MQPVLCIDLLLQRVWRSTSLASYSSSMYVHSCPRCCIVLNVRLLKVPWIIEFTVACLLYCVYNVDILTRPYYFYTLIGHESTDVIDWDNSFSYTCRVHTEEGQEMVTRQITACTILCYKEHSSLYIVFEKSQITKQS